MTEISVMNLVIIVRYEDALGSQVSQVCEEGLFRHCRTSVLDDEDI